MSTEKVKVSSAEKENRESKGNGDSSPIQSPATLAGGQTTKAEIPAPVASKRRPFIEDVVNRESEDEHRQLPSKLDGEVESGARKRTTAEMRRRRSPLLDAYKEMISSPFDALDKRYENHPQYVSQVAPQIAGALKRRERESLDGNGAVLRTPKRYADLKAYRSRVVSWLFYKGYQLRIKTNTIHLAVYYADRFLEMYTGPDVDSTMVAVTALHLASKYEDVDAVFLDEVLLSLTKPNIEESEICDLELTFFDLLQHFVGLTTSDFVSRFLHAINRENVPAIGHTARYLCALSLCHFPFTGEYYSKLAAAAVFIAHNKYNNRHNISNQRMDYPPELEVHSGYCLGELEDVVLKMVDLVKKTETMVNSKKRRASTELGAYALYRRYAAVGVATGHALPDFKAFFEAHRAATVCIPAYIQEKARAHLPAAEEATSEVEEGSGDLDSDSDDSKEN